MQSAEKIQKQYEELKELLTSIEVDLLKNLQKGNKAAGTRARKALREVKKEAAAIVKAMIALDICRAPAGALQISGHFKVEFPYVTKQITISNNSTTSHDLVRIAFSERGLEDGVANYFLVGSTKDGDGATTLNVKATELYVMCDDNHTAPVSIFGSLTNLPVSRVNNISPSGSNWSGSIGVG